MFFIFGFGKETIKTRWENYETTCDRCGNTRKWPLKKITRWFTLFFIPIFPYSTTYVKICPICGNYEEITKEQFERGDEKIEVNQEKQYVSPSQKVREKQLTEVQRRYKEEMASYEARQENNKNIDS